MGGEGGAGLEKSRRRLIFKKKSERLSWPMIETLRVKSNR